MNAQEVFDKVVAHLRTQGRKAADTTGCLYRGPDGTSCAAGCLITDEEYLPEMERTTIGGLLSSDRTPASLKDRLMEHMALLIALQNIHDNYLVVEWENRLQAAATQYGLVYTPKGE